MILIIDNYDSFTYNLVQYIGEVTDRSREIRVIRNDAASVEEIKALGARHIVLSPGPCTPNEAGISVELVKALKESTPILGVCLGHQAIAQAFGAKIVRAKQVVHGKTTKVQHDERGIFSGLEQNFLATRYHSLVVDQNTFPEDLRVSAWSTDKEIMALEHRRYPHVVGVQFHPESILTCVGKDILSRFLQW